MQVPEILLYVLKDITGLLSIVMILHNIMSSGYRKKQLVIPVYAITGIIAALSIWLFPLVFETRIDAESAADTVSSLMMIFFPFIILKCRRKLMPIVFSSLYIMTVEVIYGVIASMLPEGLITECIVMSVLFTAVIIIVKVSLVNSELNILSNVFMTVPKWIYICLAIFDLTGYYREFGISTGIYNVMYAVSTVMVIACVIYFIGKIFLLTYQQNQIIRKMDIQHEYYQQMLSSNDDVRQFRHDYKNHMMVVTSLLNSGKTKEASDYIENIQLQTGNFGRKFSTGNFIADAILNDKSSLAEEYAIHIDFTGRIPEKGILNVDLCTVVANLTDNAIEALKDFEGNKYIKIIANIRNGFLTLSFSNPAKNVKIVNNRIKSSKSDKKNHGIGLKNVENVAKKYSGNMLLSFTDNEFTADVSMKIEN